MPLDATRYPIRELLQAFKGAVAQRPELRLALAGRRSADNGFSVWNYLDEYDLVDGVDFLPYYDRCAEFPIDKVDCGAWISRDTDATGLCTSALLERLDGKQVESPKLALFVTSFHPGKYEGNSTLMRQWLEYLKDAGYRVHLVYYGIDRATVTPELHQKLKREHEFCVEVNVNTRLAGSNRNGLNVHVDDWCGKELLDEVSKLTDQFEYDVAVVNYAFMSAVFDRVAAYTKKVLITHDSFTDRNRRLLAQGYPESGWVSIDRSGEALACRRCDVVVALQEAEAELFRGMVGQGADVRVIGPLPKAPQARVAPPAAKLRIGYIGSSNYVNEHNLIAYLAEWAKDPELVRGSEIVLAGGICDSLTHFAPAELFAAVAPRMLGQVSRLYEFFETCDLSINPDTGGTGIKIKTLDAMAHGTAVLCTAAGGVGIGSASRFHTAADAAELARLTAEVVADRNLLDVARGDTRAVYAAYVARHSAAMADLLGPSIRASRAAPVRRRVDEQPELIIPDYVRQTASAYHFDEFDRVFSRIDLRGMQVLEIGSDYHLASARLFAANGAAHVLTTNLADWRSAEPLPPNVSFRAGDVADIDLPPHSIDVVYGIAILEHLPDAERVALAIKRVLSPGGVAYLQGCPLWTGPLGHHVWLYDRQISGEQLSDNLEEPLYSFADPEKNPIPNWAHLTHEPDELATLLIHRGVPEKHAEGIVRYVYNRDGKMTGSCSNFLAPSDLVGQFREHLITEAEPMISADPANEYFQKALSRYTEADLRTLGLRLWLTAQEEQPSLGIATPSVSIIIPFFNVEKYIEDCLTSVLAQDFADYEIVLVDDASQDGSRAAAERFAAADARIRIVTHPNNGGLGAARNTGVRYARGDYVLFIDSDDLLSGSDALSAMIHSALKTRCQVVIGSCERLMPDGSLVEYDRQYDRQKNGRPGSVVGGRDAFLSSLGLPGYQYLPLRAWGVLAKRRFYDELGLDFPPGEHEDLAHTPFLYLKAGAVYYEQHVVIRYRERADGLSKSPWPPAKLRRYAHLWQEMKARLLKYERCDLVGDSALAFASHLMWKIESNDCVADVGEEGRRVMQEILADLEGATNRPLLHRILDALRRQPWNSTHDFDRYSALTAAFPLTVMLEYHNSTLGIPYLPPAERPAAADPPAAALTTAQMLRVIGPPRSDDGQRSFADNAKREAMIHADYAATASDQLKAFPAMLTFGDKALYFFAAKNFGFRGSIVDGGCFVGGTTFSLVEGLRQNPAILEGRADARGLIRVYDLFTIDDDYILRHLRENYPNRDFRTRDTFLPVFEQNLEAEQALLQVRAGDVTQIGYPDSQPIELFGVDFCKALNVSDFALRTFFPHLMPGSLVIQQDFVHEFHPHIHLSMLRLVDHFEIFVELKWGGSFAFTCIKPITEEIVRERFGLNASWYADVALNASLLRRLIEECHYDENRWVFLLTLAMYYRDHGRRGEALAAYSEAEARFPQFEPSELTRRMIRGQ